MNQASIMATLYPRHFGIVMMFVSAETVEQRATVGRSSVMKA